MKKYPLFLIGGIVIISLATYFVLSSKKPTTPTNVNDVITQQLNQKYQHLQGNLIVETNKSDDKFAQGSLSFKDQLGMGGVWLAAKTKNGWQLVHDGQGPMSCELANQYNFTTDFVPGCIDTQNENTFVQR